MRATRIEPTPLQFPWPNPRERRFVWMLDATQGKVLYCKGVEVCSAPDPHSQTGLKFILCVIQEDKYLSRRSEHSSSNLALVRVVSMCLGPSAVAVINGKLPKNRRSHKIKENPERIYWEQKVIQI